MNPVVAERLEQGYRVGKVDVPDIRSVDFTIGAEAFVAFLGPSGRGKSTPLNPVGCLDHRSAGRLTELDTDASGPLRTPAAASTEVNPDSVFQDFNLVPVLPADESIGYPLPMVRRRTMPPTSVWA